jgi:hypothetical protein
MNRFRSTPGFDPKMKRRARELGDIDNHGSRLFVISFALQVESRRKVRDPFGRAIQYAVLHGCGTGYVLWPRWSSGAISA